MNFRNLGGGERVSKCFRLRTPDFFNLEPILSLPCNIHVKAYSYPPASEPVLLYSRIDGGSW